MSKHRKQLIEERHDCGGLCPEQLEDRPEHGTVLEHIVLQREHPKPDRKMLVKRDGISVLQEESTDGTGSIVACIELGGGCFGCYIEVGLEGGKEVEVL
jgi:hypothetical protein